MLQFDYRVIINSLLFILSLLDSKLGLTLSPEEEPRDLVWKCKSWVVIHEVCHTETIISQSTLSREYLLWDLCVHTTQTLIRTIGTYSK